MCWFIAVRECHISDIRILCNVSREISVFVYSVDMSDCMHLSVRFRLSVPVCPCISCNGRGHDIPHLPAETPGNHQTKYACV